MSVDLTFKTQIERPVEVVCEAVTDLPGMPRWFSVKEVRNVSAGPLGVGTQFQVVTDFMGKDRVVDYQVTDYEPCSKFAYRSQGNFPSQITMLLVPENGTTHLTLKFSVFVSGLVAPMIKGHLRKQLVEDLTRLTTMLQNQA